MISNLNVLSNIALIKQYHDNWSYEKASEKVLDCLNRYDLSHIANKRSSSLTDEEIFCIKLIRAAMVKEAIIVIDRPFKIISYISDKKFIYDNLYKIEDLFSECYIFDTYANKNRYELIYEI